MYVCSYEVEFSIPKNIKPIPEGTVKVFFTVTESDDEGNYTVEFNFENESLKHREGNTMRNNKYEVGKFKQLSNGYLYYFSLGLITSLRKS